MLYGSILVFVERIEGGISFDNHALLDSWGDRSEFPKNGDCLFPHFAFMSLAFCGVDAIGQEHQAGRRLLADDGNKDVQTIKKVLIAFCKSIANLLLALLTSDLFMSI